jgi:hypothetical protein
VATRILRSRDALVLWWRGLSPAASDAWLYLVSAGFAALMGLGSSQSAQWHWGYLSVGPFAVAAIVVMAGSRLSALAQRRWRLLVLSLVFVGVVAVPLGLESQWRPAADRVLAQPEVGVIERSAQWLTHLESPYRTYRNAQGHLVGEVKGVPAFQSFFPYFPLMSVFGLPSAVTHRETGLTDARIVMSVFTCLLMGVALALLRAPPERKIRVAQVLVVLPTGSLFLATGGDDMPILALCLLGLVALQRQRSWTAGLVIGAAAAMKLTAWPFLLVALAVSRDRDGRRSWVQVLAAASAVVLVTVAPYVVSGPRAFVANVFAFPLGLAGVASPAASPLPGHLLTQWFPPLRHVLLPAVFVVGGYLLVRFLRRRWPLDLPAALRTLAVVMTVVICSATATRLGYLIYPLNFWLWAWVFTPGPTSSVEGVVLVEAQRPAG